MESVFIAWSGNEDLANEVKEQLQNKGYRAEVGGHGPRGNFIGTQVIDQMNSCTHAIILATKRAEEDPCKFSDNLMFEWGYLLSKFPEGRVKPYLIDTSFQELPSDLGGSWAETIVTEGKSIDLVASEIVKLFRFERASLDKLEIMSKWQDVKGYISDFAARRSRSDSEMAQYVLFSVISSFYNDEVNVLDHLIENIHPNSTSLSAVISMVRSMVRAYINTEYMAKPLNLRDYWEIVNMLEREYEDYIDEDDADFKQWVHIIRLEHMQFCNYLMALATPDDVDTYFHEEVIRLGGTAVKLIGENLAQYPKNRGFAALYLSFLHRNMAVSYRVMRMEDKAIEQFNKSVKQRGDFFFHYSTRFHDDAIVCDKISQEYYLALLEQTEFEPNPRKRRQIMRTVRDYLDVWDEQSKRRHSLLNMVREAYARVEKTLSESDSKGGEQA